MFLKWCINVHLFCIRTAYGVYAKGSKVCSWNHHSVQSLVMWLPAVFRHFSSNIGWMVDIKYIYETRPVVRHYLTLLHMFCKNMLLWNFPVQNFTLTLLLVCLVICWSVECFLSENVTLVLFINVPDSFHCDNPW